MKSRKTYRVKWKIDLEATNEVDAAKEALKIMRDRGSTAIVFDVKEEKAKKKYITIDLKNYDT